jgi:hypothetical protein
MLITKYHAGIFFPKLDSTKKNPRRKIVFLDNQNKEWPFNFIYYNSKFFKGTRDEYRLTGMTSFLKFYSLKSGDEFRLTKELGLDGYKYFVDFLKQDGGNLQGSKLKLSGKWRILPLNGGGK